MASGPPRTAQVAILGLVAGPLRGAFADQTDITWRLNSLVQRGSDYSKVYEGGGTGVLVRNPFDGYEDDTNKQVVPTTFLHNDIFAGMKVFPSFNEQTGMDFETPSMAYVIGSGMRNVFYDFDNIQSYNWGWGVFYAWDSNAADSRCRWLETYQSYDCPGYAIPWGRPPQKRDDLKGAGNYDAGNPMANPKWGGGAGCHFSAPPYGCHDPVICQYNIDQVNRAPTNLVQNKDCECNYIFNDDWGHWVAMLGQIEQDRLPEAAMCWVNNLRDMIRLQNALWWGRTGWFNPEGQPPGPVGYWGWNEIPASRWEVTKPVNWDAVMIKVPVFACGGDGGNDSLNCLSAQGGQRLETTLDQWVTSGKILPGFNNLVNRPGSYVVIHREYRDSSGNFFNWFFCESWTSPSGRYAIRFKEASNGDPGFCYLDKTGADLSGNATLAI